MQVKYERFYDQDPVLSQAVQVMRMFPEDMQAIIADSLSMIAERECQASALMEDLKSIGTEKVLAIYKSKQKKRDYDQSPSLHRAMNYLSILSGENRAFIARKIMELMGYIQEYLKTCQGHSIPAETQAVEALADVYVKFGPDRCKQFLNDMEAEFVRKVSSERLESLNPPKSTFSEAITDESQGLRIKGTD